MTSTVETLLHNLENEHRHLESLVTLLEAKRDAIVQNDRECLVRILGEEDTLLVSIGILEEGRSTLVRYVAEELGLALSPAPPRIGDLARELEPRNAEQTGRLRDLRERLRDTIQRLGRLTRLCATLVNHSIEHTNHFFAAVTKALTGPPIYDRRGDLRPLAKMMIDQRA